MIGGVPDVQRRLLLGINAAIDSVDDATVYDTLTVVTAVLVSNARLFLDKAGDSVVDLIIKEMRSKIDSADFDNELASFSKEISGQNN